MKVFTIASIPGDGIGKETVPAGRSILDTVCEVHGGLKLEYLDLDWNCEYYLRHGRMMPENGLETSKPTRSLDVFGFYIAAENDRLELLNKAMGCPCLGRECTRCARE